MCVNECADDKRTRMGPAFGMRKRTNWALETETIRPGVQRFGERTRPGMGLMIPNPGKQHRQCRGTENSQRYRGQPNFPRIYGCSLFLCTPSPFLDLHERKTGSFCGFSMTMTSADLPDPPRILAWEWPPLPDRAACADRASPGCGSFAPAGRARRFGSEPPIATPRGGGGLRAQSIRTFTTTFLTAWRPPAMQPGLCASSGKKMARSPGRISSELANGGSA